MASLPLIGIGSQKEIRTSKMGGASNGKRLVRLIACTLALLYVQAQVASARPHRDSSSSVVQRNSQDDLFQLVQKMVHDSQYADENRAAGSGSAAVRSPGKYSVHPLPRSTFNEGAVAQQQQQQQQQQPLINVVQARQDLPTLETAAASGQGNGAAAPTQGLPVLQAAAASSSPSASQDSQDEDPSSATSAPSASSAPLSSAAPVITPASASKSNSNSKTDDNQKPTPTSSNKPDDEKDDNQPPTGLAAIFSPSNKLFPLAIAICVAVGLGSLFIAISIGKCISHRQLKRDKINGNEKYSAKDSSVLVGADTNSRGGGMGRTRTLGKSLRRALTRGKLGGNSFARRTREGTVLIDVGDEVLAVTPEVAREYERERKSVVSGSGGASRLTTPSNQPTPSRQALYNAQLIVAANQAEAVRGKPQAPRGFDINSWRAEASTLPGVMEDDDERTLYGSYGASNASKDSLNKGYDNNGVSGGGYASVGRSLSQRLANGLRALTGAGRDDEDTLGEPKTTSLEKAFSFDAEKQTDLHAIRQAQVPLSATVPVLTRGGGGWAIERHADAGAGAPRAQAHQVARKHASDSTLRDSALSHERVTLRDGAVPTGAASARRPKSILIKRSQDSLKDDQAAPTSAGPMGAYRNRPAQPKQQVQQEPLVAPRRPQDRYSTSTSTGSPRMLQNRFTLQPTGVSSTAAGAASAGLPTTRKPIVLKPEMPVRGITANKGGKTTSSSSSSSSSTSRELYRPLPLPPAVSPMVFGGKGMNGGGGGAK